MKKSIVLVTFSMIIGLGANSQVTDLGKFLAGGPDDAKLLMEGYLAPYFNAFGASLTGGWYNTAKPHQLGGFDLTVTANTAIVPDADKVFDISTLGLSSLVLSGEEGTTPTVAGESEQGVELAYNLPGNPKAFDMPEGIGLGVVPTPMLQLGVGLIKDTELNGRYMPKISKSGFEIDMWGLGFKHGLKQWLPFIKRIPVLHLSLQYGYTQLNSSVAIEVEPSDIQADYDVNTGNYMWDDQSLEFVTKSHTANILVSANLPVVCFYGGVGFATTNSELALKGAYPMIDPIASASASEAIVTDSYVEQYGTDPFTMEVKNSDGSTTKPRLNVGMRLKFGVVTLHGDYTYANYSMASAGIGISFR